MRRYVREAQGLPLTNVCNLFERPPKIFKRETMDITFIGEDARTVHHPHSDALVVTAVIGNVNVRRLLMDNSSSINILAHSMYEKMKMVDKDMMVFYYELYSFTGNAVQIVGRVKFPITLGVEPLATTQVAKFVIVNEDISYNGNSKRDAVCYLNLPPVLEIFNPEWSRICTRMPSRIPGMLQQGLKFRREGLQRDPNRRWGYHR